MPKTTVCIIDDRGQRESSQVLGNTIGCVIRLNYEIPSSKKKSFVDEEGALTEIYTYGHCNAQKMDTFNETETVLLIRKAFTQKTSGCICRGTG